MRVGFDHQVFTFQKYGGISRYFFELASRLPTHGVSPLVVAPLHINEYLAAATASEFTRGRYVPHNSGPLPFLIGLADWLAAPVAWHRMEADVLHETYFSFRPVTKAQRRVVTIYDMIHELFMPEAKSAIAAKRATINRADHIICISENTRRDLVRLYDVDPGKTSVVYLGHSLTAATNEVDTRRLSDRPYILYVGIRKGYKNFSTLLKAYASSAKLREFDLIAFGGHPLLPDEQRDISRLGVEHLVKFETGPDTELTARYQQATAFIYPSKYEGFGLPPVEAMSHGCPAVCSNAGSIPEIVGDAGVYFDPNSAEDLRTALERVVTDEHLQADLRERGHVRAAEFSWDRCAADTAQVYRNII